MLENLLKKCYDEELPTSCDSESVKTAVLLRIEKENHVKRFKIKPLIIAAAVVAAAAVSIVTVNASRDGVLTPKEPKKQEYICGEGQIYYSFNQADSEFKDSTIDATIDDFSTEGMTLVNESETAKGGLWIVSKTFAEDLPNDSNPLARRQRVIGEKAVYNDEGEHYFTIFVTGVFDTNGECAELRDGGHYFAKTENAGQVKDHHTHSYAMKNQFEGSNSSVEYTASVRLGESDCKWDFTLRIEADPEGNIYIGK